MHPTTVMGQAYRLLDTAVALHQEADSHENCARVLGPLTLGQIRNQPMKIKSRRTVGRASAISNH